MDSNAILKRIVETLDVDPDSISLETIADDVETWDSMGTMSLLLMLSQDFGITLPPNQTEHLRSVKGILQLINRNDTTS